MNEAAPRPGYRGYRLRAAMMVVFLQVYVVIAFTGLWNAERGEIFPFFSWSLFSNSSDRVTLLEVMVHRIGEREFDPPIPYTALKGEFRRANSSSAPKMVAMYVTGMDGPPEEEERRRRVIEKQLFDGRDDIDYEIRRTLFVPLDRWRDGTILGHAVIARRTVGADQ